MKLVVEGVFHIVWAVSASDYPQLPANRTKPLYLWGFLLRVVVRTTRMKCCDSPLVRQAPACFSHNGNDAGVRSHCVGSERGHKDEAQGRLGWQDVAVRPEFVAAC